MIQYICKKCSKEVELESGAATGYNQMAIQDNWCEKCWYYEHWRPYKLWIAERMYPIHGWVEIDPPDSCTVYYESYGQVNTKERDWQGRFKVEHMPARQETLWLMENEKELAKRLSAEYKTTVLICGSRAEEAKTVFGIAYNGQLFVPEKESEDETK